MKSQTDCSGILKLRVDSEGWVLAETMNGVRMPGNIKGGGQEARGYKRQDQKVRHYKGRSEGQAL